MIGYDCPAVDDMERFVRLIAGSSLTAAEGLTTGAAKVAINWFGGWHHAQRDAASGFCYINDIVIAIHLLRTKFKKILYIDLDVHHGDGVENAFNFSRNIVTLSIHHYEAGYFPGTGSVENIGLGKGKYFAINVPLKSGITDGPYFSIFSKVFDQLLQKFTPEAIVIQCGSDCIASDPLGTFNLTEVCLGKCLKKILDLNIPTLILGGGGYNLSNSARCWTYLTSVVVGTQLSPEIPDHDYFIKYGPDFELTISPTLRKDENDETYINNILRIIQGNIQAITVN